MFKLKPIITDGKPGELINLDIEYINKLLNINFKPNKMFYITDLNSELSRGNHSNVNASEILICLNGEFHIMLHDGVKEETYIIKRNEGIYIPNNIWLEFKDFKNCVVLAYVDIDYEIKKESIYSFDEFRK